MVRHIKQKMKVGVYARVSTDDQHTSIENQHDIFNKWISQNNCELYDIYTDEAISGTKGYKRKNWQRLIEDIGAKRFDILLVKSFSRFGRNQRETLDVIAKLKSAGMRFVFLEDGIDSQRDATTVGLFAWLAEQEAQRTSERLKLIWRKYDEDGIIHVCLPPFGYEYDPETRNYVANEEEAAVVRRIFSLYIQGYGCTKIANQLREAGIRTKRGGQWANNTIRKILCNEVYKGTLVQGITRSIDVTLNEREAISPEKWHRHPNHHTAIISAEIFSKVQALMQERSKHAKGFSQSEKQDAKLSRHSNSSLFSNLLTCGECGSSMSVKRKRDLKNYAPYYNCIAYELKGKKFCGHSSNFIWENVLTAIVGDELQRQAQNDLQCLKELLRQSKFESRPKGAEIELRMVNAKIGRQLKLSMTLQINHEKGLVGNTQFKLQNEIIENNLQTFLMRKKVLEGMINDTPKTDEEAVLAEGINELVSLPSEKWINALLKTIISRITVYLNGSVHVDFQYLNNKNCNQCFNRKR